MSDRELRFDDEVIVVTGGGRGMGRAHCLGLADRGAAVVVVDIDESAAHGVAAELNQRGGCGLAAVVTSDAVTHSAVVEVVLGRFGRVDAIVNNAGIAHDRVLREETDADFDRLFEVHMKLPFHLVRAAWDELVRRRGRVVNVVSNAALFGKSGMTTYAASKGALVAWTRALALEAGPLGVRVNAAAPVAATRLTEGLLGDLTNRLGPDRVTPTIVTLAHRDCVLNGEVVSVAGDAVARIVTARVPSGLACSAEDVRRLLDGPPDLATASAPTSAADEVSYVRNELGTGRTAD